MERYFKLRRRCKLGVSVIAITLIAAFNSTTVQAADSSSPVTVHQHVNFNGRLLSVGEGEVTIQELRSSVGNDTISSITIEPGYSVLACKNSGLRGRCELLSSDASDLRTISFNDVISSLLVSQSPASSPVAIFKDVNFNGRFLGLGEGEVTIQDLRSSVGNDRVSSITIEPGYSVLACQDSRLRGRCDVFTSDVSDLRTISFNDVISSLRVTKLADQPPVTVFQHVNFNGNSLAIEQEGVITIQDLRISTVGNDVISSIQISEGYSVRACEHSRSGGSGRCETFTSSITDLRTIGFNDTISFLSVTRGSVTPDPEPEPNSAPVASDLALQTTADAPIQFTLADLENVVTDADGDQLTFEVASSDGAGSSLAQSLDTFTFDPTSLFADLPLGEVVDVVFPYSVEDAAGATGTGSVIISVEGIAIAPEPNSAPVASDLALDTTADAPIQFTLADLENVVTDADGDQLTFTVVLSNGVGFSLTQSADTFTFDPTSLFADLPLGEVVDVVFTYSVEDAEGATDTARINIDIEGVAITPEPNSVPVASNFLLQTTANTPVQFTTADLRNMAITDADGDFLTIIFTVSNANGNRLTRLDRETLAFDPTTLFADLPLGEVVDVVFPYTAVDPEGARDTASIIIRVVGVVPRPAVDFTASVRVTEPDGDLIAGVVISDALTGDQLGVTGEDGSAVIEVFDAAGQMNLLLTSERHGNQITPLTIVSGAASAVLEITMKERVFVFGVGEADVGFGFEFNTGGSFDPIVSFEEDSFFTANGERVSQFDIELLYTTVDVSNAAELEAFPGSFTGTQPNGNSTSIASLGTSEYVFRNRRTGEELQLEDGSSAQISLPLYIDTRPDTGESIGINDSLPIWSLNETTGIWTQEAIGTVVASNSSPTGMAVEATVSHFTWWNIDVPIDTGFVTINVEGSGVDGTASITAAAAASGVAFRAVYGSVPIGGSYTTVIPADTEYCFSGIAQLPNGATGSTNTVCANVSTGDSVDITLVLAGIDASLAIAADLTVGNSGNVSVDGIAGVPVPRVRIDSSTFETNVAYTATNLPEGIRLVASSDTAVELVGVPVNAGSFNVVVTGTNADGETDFVPVQYEISADPTALDLTVVLFGSGERDVFDLASFFEDTVVPDNWELIGPDPLPVGLLFSESERRHGMFRIEGEFLFAFEPGYWDWTGVIRATFPSGVVVDYNVTFIYR